MAKKKTAKPKAAKVALDQMDRKLIGKIRDTAGGLRSTILAKKEPNLKFPLRALANVAFNVKKGHFTMKGKTVDRSLTVNTVKTFAQMLRMLSLSKTLIETNDFATKRDAYYQTKNWDDARCDDQVESDTIMDDIEALFLVNKEQIGFRPDEHGGAVAGELVVIDRDASTGRPLRIDCTKFGSGAYSIPSSVEHLGFETKAKFILAIETSGMFERLNHHQFWAEVDCILVSMNGVPSRAIRRFIRRLADEKKLPVYVFTDGDPYGYANIYRTLKVGSGNNAHLNEFFCVPQATYLGVTPDDIDRYKLPTHPLKEVDIKRSKDAIKNDPFFVHHREWSGALEKMMKMGVRVEQQAFAKHGLNFVLEKYLPEKLKHPERFLP
ncbi:MAG: DNA topoisomerase IV subunit A [Bdellovibrionota bacterium]